MNALPLTKSPSADTTYLYLVRHGATDANLMRPYVLQGRGIDLPLSKVGREQASALGRYLVGQPFSRVYASPMKRAVETGRSIASGRDRDVDTVDGLQECDVGQWEGMDWDSVMQQHPEHYRAFMDNPADVPYLGGESYRDVLRRVKVIIGNLLIRHRGETIAIVAHNVVNRTFLADLLGLELRKAKDLKQSNCCVNVIRYRNGETSLLTMNSVFHLGPRGNQ